MGSCNANTASGANARNREATKGLQKQKHSKEEKRGSTKENKRNSQDNRQSHNDHPRHNQKGDKHGHSNVSRKDSSDFQCKLMCSPKSHFKDVEFSGSPILKSQSRKDSYGNKRNSPAKASCTNPSQGIQHNEITDRGTQYWDLEGRGSQFEPSRTTRNSASGNKDQYATKSYASPIRNRQTVKPLLSARGNQTQHCGPSTGLPVAAKSHANKRSIAAGTSSQDYENLNPYQDPFSLPPTMPPQPYYPYYVPVPVFTGPIPPLPSIIHKSPPNRQPPEFSRKTTSRNVGTCQSAGLHSSFTEKKRAKQSRGTQPGTNCVIEVLQESCDCGPNVAVRSKRKSKSCGPSADSNIEDIQSAQQIRHTKIDRTQQENRVSLQQFPRNGRDRRNNQC